MVLLLSFFGNVEIGSTFRLPGDNLECTALDYCPILTLGYQDLSLGSGFRFGIKIGNQCVWNQNTHIQKNIRRKWT